METLRTETAVGVREIVLARPEAYNTITPALRDEPAAPAALTMIPRGYAGRSKLARQ